MAIKWYYSVRSIKTWRRISSLSICSFCSSEQKNVWFWSMDFIMLPSSALLYSQRSPLCLIHDSAAGHFFKDSLGKDHMAILIIIVNVFVTVLNLFGEMRHFSFNPFSLFQNIVLIIFSKSQEYHSQIWISLWATLFLSNYFLKNKLFFIDWYTYKSLFQIQLFNS